MIGRTIIEKMGGVRKSCNRHAIYREEVKCHSYSYIPSGRAHKPVQAAIVKDFSQLLLM